MVKFFQWCKSIQQGLLSIKETQLYAFELEAKIQNSQFTTVVEQWRDKNNWESLYHSLA